MIKRHFLAVAAALFLLSAQTLYAQDYQALFEALPSVRKVEKIDGGQAFPNKYLLWFEQPISHKDPSKGIPDLDDSCGYDCSDIREYLKKHAGEKPENELLYDCLSQIKQKFIEYKKRIPGILEKMRSKKKRYEDYQEYMNRRKSDKPMKK